jgi:hypothetical protein
MEDTGAPLPEVTGSEREDKLSKWEPVYPQTLHSDVVGECRKWWLKKRPWTVIRALRKGVDTSEGASCSGSQGNFHIPCTEKVVCVQYTSAFGDPQFYCEKHAMLQIDCDINLYDGPRPVYED